MATKPAANSGVGDVLPTLASKYHKVVDQAVSTDKSAKEIGHELNLSPKKVHNYLSEVYGILGISNRIALSRLIIDERQVRYVDLSKLTPQQRVIFGLMGQGLTNAQVALEIGRNEVLIHKQNSKMRKSLGVSGRVELGAVAYAHDLGRKVGEVAMTAQPEVLEILDEIKKSSDIGQLPTRASTNLVATKLMARDIATELLDDPAAAAITWTVIKYETAVATH